MDEAAEKKSRTLAMICHLGGLLAFFGVPLGNLLGPLLFWRIFKKNGLFVEDQGKEAVNFQISVCLYGAVCGLLTFITIGYWLLGLLVLAMIVLVLIAATQAYRGLTYRYPFNFRFIK